MSLQFSSKRHRSNRAPSHAKGARAKGRRVALTRYHYSALDENGKKVTGYESAPSTGAVHISLLQRGLKPIEVTTHRSIMKYEITKKKVPRQDVMNFTRQLAVFIAAGIPIMEALEIIVMETPNKLLRKVVYALIDNLRAGDTFASAAAQHPEAFPNFYVGILESAEYTGNLDQVLNQLADYIDRDTKARGKISAALIYPSVVAVMSIATVLILALFVLPRFTTFFASLHAKLPLPTRMMMASSSFIIHNLSKIGIVVFLFVVGFTAMRRSKTGRAQLDRIVLKLPVIGDLTQLAILERICRILSSMLKAGVDLPRSMTVTAESSNNAVYHRALERVREAMMEGQGISGPIARTGLFPGAARQMFRVGEETGTLDQQLDVAAVYYNRELETKLQKATALFEPAIIIFMGLVVGFVAIALISAMYGIYSQVKVG